MQLQSLSASGGANSSRTGAHEGLKVQQALSVTNTSPSTKILQCQHACAVLFRIGNRYVTLSGDIPCYLQVMEKNNAIVLAECLERLSAVTSSSDVFALQSRIASRDQAGANKKAERGIMQERQKGKWTGL